MISFTITVHWKCYFPDYFVNKHENTLLASSESDLRMKFNKNSHFCRSEFGPLQHLDIPQANSRKSIWPS